MMALRSSLVRLARSDLLSKPAGAPVFSKDLTETKARSKQFFRDVSAAYPAPINAPRRRNPRPRQNESRIIFIDRRAQGCPPEPYPIPLTRYPFIVSTSLSGVPPGAVGHEGVFPGGGDHDGQVSVTTRQRMAQVSFFLSRCTGN